MEHKAIRFTYTSTTLSGLLRQFLQQSSEQKNSSPLMELEYRTPSTRSLNSLLHELQGTYIFYHMYFNNICYKAIDIE